MMLLSAFMVLAFGVISGAAEVPAANGTNRTPKATRRTTPDNSFMPGSLPFVPEPIRRSFVDVLNSPIHEI